MNSKWFFACSVVLSGILGLLATSIFFEDARLTWQNIIYPKWENYGIKVQASQTTKPQVNPDGKESSEPVRRKISYFGRVREAQKLIEHEYYKRAAVELSHAIRLKPEKLEPYLLLSEIYLRLKKFDKLEMLIAQLERIDKNHPEILTIRVRKWIHEEKWGLALDYLQSKNVISGDLLFYKSVLLALQNDHQAAKEILKTLSKAEIKELSFTLTNEGIDVDEENESNNTIYLTKPQKNKVTDLSIVYEEFNTFKDGQNAHLFALIAKELADHNEPVLAKAFADSSLKDEASYIDAWLLRGYAQYLSQDFLAAYDDFNQAYLLDPVRPRTQYFLGVSLYEMNRYEEAALHFEKALEYGYDLSEDIEWKLIDIFVKQQKYGKALNLYERLITYKTPKDKVSSALVLAIDLAKSPEIALSIMQTIIENDPSLENMNLYAWALVANEKVIEAETLLKELNTEFPKNPQIIFNYGLLYETTDKFSKAKKSYKQSYQLAKNNAEYINLANLAAKKFNQLINKENRPDTPDNLSDRSENSP